MTPHIEYSVTVPVSVDAAFQAFQDLGRLLHRGIYQEAAWVEGAPWQVGSRVRYVLTKPFPTSISAVVSSISPPRAINMINHAMGVVGEQSISFGPDLKGGTRVRMTVNLVGESSELPASALYEAVTFVVKDALDTMAALCRSRASFASG